MEEMNYFELSDGNEGKTNMTKEELKEVLKENITITNWETK